MFLADLKQRLSAAVQAFAAQGKSVPFSGSGGASGGNWLDNIDFRIAGAKLDLTTAQRDAWKNSAVSVCLNWYGTSLPQAPSVVNRVDASGKLSPVPGHALSQLLRRPNPYYAGRALLSATAVSFLANGNAYWFKVRDDLDRVVQLWYTPHWMVEPKWPTDGSEFISHYDYRVGGQVYHMAPSEVVHLRYGLDPENPRKGISPLRWITKEICTDNEASTYDAALLTNAGIPGLIIAPTATTKKGEVIDIDEETIKKMVKSKTTGANRGEAIVMPMGVDVHTLGFSPEQLALDKMREVPESRITAALQLPAQVVGLQVGHAQKTYSNYTEARKAAWEDGVLPLWDMWNDDLDLQLLPDFAVTNRMFCLSNDLTRVRALQENEDARHKRAVGDFQGGLITRNEGRTDIGKDSVDGGDVFIQDLAPAQDPLLEQDNAPDPDE